MCYCRIHVAGNVGGLALNEAVQYLVTNIAHLCIRECIAVLSLEVYLNNTVSLKNYKTSILAACWHQATNVAAKCTARLEGYQVGPKVLLRALCHYVLPAEIVLADFNLEVSTLTAKLPT